MRLTSAETKREAIVSAIEDFDRRMRLAALVRFVGSCPELIAPDELQAARRRG